MQLIEFKSAESGWKIYINPGKVTKVGGPEDGPAAISLVGQEKPVLVMQNPLFVAGALTTTED